MFIARFKRREDGGYDASYGKGSKKLSAVIMQEKGTWAVTQGHGDGVVRAYQKLGDVKNAWGASAESSYGTAEAPGSVPLSPKLSGPPSLKRAPKTDLAQVTERKGPPSLRAAQGLEPVHSKRDGETPSGAGNYVPTTWEVEMGLFEQNPSVPKAPEGGTNCPSCHQPLTGWHKTDGKWLPPCRCNFPNDDTYEPDPFDPRMYETGPDHTLRHLTPVGALDKVYAWMLRNKDYVTTNDTLDAPWSDVQEVLNRVTSYAEYRKEIWE